MIDKQDYIKLLDLVTSYLDMYKTMFNKPVSDEFAKGMKRVLDFVETLVDKKQ